MVNVRNLARTLKTRNKEAYAELSPQIGGPEEGKTYPFSTGFELFSASLIVGYMYDDGTLIEEEAERRYADEDDEEILDDQVSNGHNSSDDFMEDEEEEIDEDAYHTFTTMNQVLDNNEDHAYTIELVDRIIAIELAAYSDNDEDEIPEDVWNLVVEHADKGVGIIRQQWKSGRKIELDDRFDELEDFWREKIEGISSQLTQIPTREDDGRIQPGD